MDRVKKGGAGMDRVKKGGAGKGEGHTIIDLFLGGPAPPKMSIHILPRAAVCLVHL